MGRHRSLVGVQSGIGLRFAAPVAKQVGTAELVICWDTACQRRQVTLLPSSTVTDNGCAASGPDAVCSADAAKSAYRQTREPSLSSNRP